MTASGHRFIVEVDGLECELVYRLAGSVMTITHTGVPDPLAGRGIGDLLMGRRWTLPVLQAGRCCRPVRMRRPSC